MPSPDAIAPRQLAKLVGTPDAPAIIDVRIEEDRGAHPRRLPGAIRHPFTDVEALAPPLAGRRAVVVCEGGLKISQGAAALLRGAGVAAEVLEGGHAAWREAGLPLLSAEAPEPPTRWVTRHRPKVDRIAVPWLVRRFVDPRARILYVAPGEVAAVAERFRAIPFDAEGAALGPREGRCAFDAALAWLGLDGEPALQRVAAIVRAADRGRPGEVPEAAGLLAASLGLSRMHRDDLAQLEAGMTLYDALYRWARDARDETHGPHA